MRNATQQARSVRGDILKETRKTNYARVGAKELPTLLKQIEIYRGTPITRLAMKLIALTFVRTSELIGARWQEVDLEGALWDIPDERMKMRTPHIVPLARQTLEVLGMLRELSRDGEWVFPGNLNPQKHMSNNTILKGLERMGCKGRMTGHGFRGVASTIMSILSFNWRILLGTLSVPHTTTRSISNHAPRCSAA